MRRFLIIYAKQENYDVRKASSKILEQIILRAIHFIHNLTGRKTNIYVIAREPGKSN